MYNVVKLQEKTSLLSCAFFYSSILIWYQNMLTLFKYLNYSIGLFTFPCNMQAHILSIRG